MMAWSKLIPSSAAEIVAREMPCDAASCLKPSSQRSKLPVLLRQGAAVAGAAMAATASAARAMERNFTRSMFNPYLRIDRQSARGMPAVKARPGRIPAFAQGCGGAVAGPSLPGEHRANAVDHELHRERGEQHAEQSRQHHIRRGAEQRADPDDEKEDGEAQSDHDQYHPDQREEEEGPSVRLGGEQHRCGDRAGPRHQRNGKREGGDMAKVL